MKLILRAKRDKRSPRLALSLELMPRQGRWEENPILALELELMLRQEKWKENPRVVLDLRSTLRQGREKGTQRLLPRQEKRRECHFQIYFFEISVVAIKGIECVYSNLECLCSLTHCN